MAISIKTQSEIKLMAEGGKILRAILRELTAAVRPGLTTASLDQLARELVFSYSQKFPQAKIKPSFWGYRGYPAYLCVSLNDEVVHGLPAEREIKEGDLVSLDFGVVYHSWHTDAAVTVAVGEVSVEAAKLLLATKEALSAGLKAVKAGKNIGDIGFAVQKYVEKKGFSVVRELVGHGVGRELHEEPLVPNYGHPGKGPVLQEGMVLAIEPMVTAGRPEVFLANDGWTYKTKDGSWAAHFEETVAVTKNGPVVLTE